MSNTNTFILYSKKGGTGRSTLALNLTMASILDYKKTLLIDATEYESISYWYKERQQSSFDHHVPFTKCSPPDLSICIESATKKGYDNIIVDTDDKIFPAQYTQHDPLFIVTYSQTVSSLEMARAAFIDLYKSGFHFCVVLSKVRAEHNFLEEKNVFPAGSLCPIAVKHSFIHGLATGNGGTIFELQSKYPPGTAMYESLKPEVDDINNVFQWISKYKNVSRPKLIPVH